MEQQQNTTKLDSLIIKPYGNKTRASVECGGMHLGTVELQGLKCTPRRWRCRPELHSFESIGYFDTKEEAAVALAKQWRKQARKIVHALIDVEAFLREVPA